MTRHLPITPKARRILQRHAKLAERPDMESPFRSMGNWMAVCSLIFGCIHGCMAGIAGKADDAAVALGLIGITFTILGWRMVSRIVRSIWLWRLTKKMRRMRDSGEIIVVDDRLMELWQQAQEKAGIQNQVRAGLDQFPDTLRSVAEGWRLIRTRPDNASSDHEAQIIGRIKHEMDDALSVVVTQEAFERKSQILADQREEEAREDLRTNAAATWDAEATFYLNRPKP